MTIAVLAFGASFAALFVFCKRVHINAVLRLGTESLWEIDSFGGVRKGN